MLMDWLLLRREALANKISNIIQIRKKIMNTQFCNKTTPREKIIVDMCFLKLEAILPIPFGIGTTVYSTIQCKHAAASRSEHRTN